MKIAGVRLHSISQSRDNTELNFSTAQLGPIRTGLIHKDVSFSITNVAPGSFVLEIGAEYEIEIRRVKTQEELNKEKSDD